MVLIAWKEAPRSSDTKGREIPDATRLQCHLVPGLHRARAVPRWPQGLGITARHGALPLLPLPQCPAS